MKNLRFIFGGTFDPIHYGHINPIKTLATVFDIEKVFLMPNKVPVHKNKAMASEQQRLDMLKLVCQEESLFEIERFELESSNNSYTATTLSALSKCYEEQKLIFIMGADSWLNFESWHNYQYLATHYHFIVLHRPYGPSSVTKAAKQKNLLATVANKLGLKAFSVSTVAQDQVSLAHASWLTQNCSVTFCQLDLFDVSSSEIRTFFKHGNDFANIPTDCQRTSDVRLDHVRNKLPLPVLEYILKHNIYS